jgi:hypothetical protein
MPFITLKEKGFWGTIFAVLIVTWLLSILASLTLGGTIHVLLALAFAMFVIALIRREWPREYAVRRREDYTKDTRELAFVRSFSADPGSDKARSPDPYRLRQVA